MKVLTPISVLSVVVPFSWAFAPLRPQSLSFSISQHGTVPLKMAIEDLENKLLTDEPKMISKKPSRLEEAKKKPEPKKNKKGEKKKEVDDLKSLLSSTEPPAATKKAPVPPTPKVSKPAPEKKPKLAREKAPKPAPAPKVKYEVASPFEKKETPRVVVPKSAPRTPREGKSKLTRAPPKVKVPVAADPNAKPVGVALGAAPLLTVPVVALAAGRTLLAKTAARREQIQKEIAADMAAKKRRQIQVETDAAALAKAVGFLGAGGAALALILSNPFAGVQSPGGFKIDLPAVNMPPTTTVVTPVAPKKAKDPSGYKLDLDSAAKRRAVRAEDALKAKKEKKEAEKKAAKAEAAEKKAEAVKKGGEAAKAKAAEKRAEATEKKAEAAEKKAEAAEKKASEEAQAKVAQKKAAEEAKAEAIEKKAEAANAPAPLPAPAPVPPKSDLVAPAPKSNPSVIKDPNAGGIGVVSGSETGGKVLPKEEISAETLEFLKNYKK